MNLLMSPKSQFKFQIEDDLRERLNTAAKRFGRDTAQEVVEEILIVYFPVWSALNESARRVVEYQARILADNSERLIDAVRTSEERRRARERSLEPVPDEQVHMLPDLGRLSDETAKAKQKPVKKKAGGRR